MSMFMLSFIFVSVRSFEWKEPVHVLVAYICIVKEDTIIKMDE